MYFLLFSGNPVMGKWRNRSAHFGWACRRREGSEGLMALRWGVHMQCCFCGSLCAHPAAPGWPGFAGSISRSVACLQTHVLLCRAPSPARERSHGPAVQTLPSQRGWALAQRSALARRDGNVGEERGKGTGERVWAPGKRHETSSPSVRGQRYFWQLLGWRRGLLSCARVPSRVLRLRPRSESEPRCGNLILHVGGVPAPRCFRDGGRPVFSSGSPTWCSAAHPRSCAGAGWGMPSECCSPDGTC